MITNQDSNKRITKMYLNGTQVYTWDSNANNNSESIDSSFNQWNHIYIEFNRDALSHTDSTKNVEACWMGLSSRNGNGYLDEIRYFNRGLTNPEITYLSNPSGGVDDKFVIYFNHLTNPEYSPFTSRTWGTSNQHWRIRDVSLMDSEQGPESISAWENAVLWDADPGKLPESIYNKR